MAYSELIKNFEGIRDYIREFYVYGFRSRDEFRDKSSRAYDNERRRIESWLGDHVRFRNTPDGKNVFLSVDSRMIRHNPLFRAWKTKSFTDREITLHFILLDILSGMHTPVDIRKLTVVMDSYLQYFSDPVMFDESTIRKKLQEYADEGIVILKRTGRTTYYSLSGDMMPECGDALDFFSEVSPCGVVGSFLLDKLPLHDSIFAFKHHYITSAIDSGILEDLFDAIRERRITEIETVNRHRGTNRILSVVPLQIRISVQSGRQYLMAYVRETERIKPFRTDNILRVTKESECGDFGSLRAELDAISGNIWGVSTDSRDGNRMEHIEFSVTYEDNEKFIPERLEREKRTGTVVHGSGTSSFSADVFDASELIPWIRTFICRITEFSCSNKKLEEQFIRDIRDMYAMYGTEDGNDVQ